jgi:hypothetical protein
MINETSGNSLLFLRYFSLAPSRIAGPPTPTRSSCIDVSF